MEMNTSQMINLNGSNYQLWKTRMEDFLYVNGIHQPVICSENPDDKTNDELNLLNRRVCGYIRQWVDDNMLIHVSGETNARILWSKLEQLCAPKTCNTKLYLMKQLMNLRYHDGTAMLDHLNIFQEIVNGLSERGVKIDDEVQGLWLLSTLPDSWDNPLLNSASVISLELVKNNVLNEEIRRKSQGFTLYSNTLAVVAPHLYTTIKVARDEDLREQIGKHIFFDLVDFDKVHSFPVRKQISCALFKEEVAKEFDIPVQYQRFWLWAKRENQTYRPFRPLTSQEEAQPVGQLREVLKTGELKLFLEDSRPVPPPAKAENEILLFFKLYDPSSEKLRYVGRLFVKNTGKPKEIVRKLNEMAGFAPDQEIQLFEEIKFEPTVMIYPIDQELTYLSSQLEDGDIICFQKPLLIRYPDVPSFMEHVHFIISGN